MSSIDPTELAPGLVVRLDTARLRALGGSLTNATRTDTEDRAVQGVHDFLVLSVDATGVALAVPLFPKTAPGSSPLDPRKRTGDADGWADTPAFYSHWQHWRIPASAIAEASEGDPGSHGARRGWAAADRDALQDASNWATRNRNGFRRAE